MKSLAIVVTALGVFVSLSAKAQVVWNFTSGDGSPSSLEPNISGSVFTAGNIPIGSAIVFNSSSASNIAGSSSGNNATIRTLASTTLDTTTSSYFEFTLTPDTGYALQATALALNSRGTGTAPTGLALYSSQDSYTTALATTTALADSNWHSITLGSFNLTGAADASITFRLYGAPSGTSSQANWRIDDVKMSVTALSAVPEPSTYAAILGGLALVGVMACRRKQVLAPR